MNLQFLSILLIIPWVPQVSCDVGSLALGSLGFGLGLLNAANPKWREEWMTWKALKSGCVSCLRCLDCYKCISCLLTDLEKRGLEPPRINNCYNNKQDVKDLLDGLHMFLEYAAFITSGGPSLTDFDVQRYRFTNDHLFETFYFTTGKRAAVTEMLKNQSTVLYTKPGGPVLRPVITCVPVREDPTIPTISSRRYFCSQVHPIKPVIVGVTTDGALEILLCPQFWKHPVMPEKVHQEDCPKLKDDHLSFDMSNRDNRFLKYQSYFLLAGILEVFKRQETPFHIEMSGSFKLVEALTDGYELDMNEGDAMKSKGKRSRGESCWMYGRLDSVYCELWYLAMGQQGCEDFPNSYRTELSRRILNSTDPPTDPVMLNYAQQDLMDFQNGGEPNFTDTDLDAKEQKITDLRGEPGNIAETSSVSSKTSSQLLHHLILSLIGVTPDKMKESILKSGPNPITELLTSDVSLVYPHLSELSPSLLAESMSRAGSPEHPSIESLNIEGEGPEWERLLGQYDWRWQGSSSSNLTGTRRPQAAAEEEEGFDGE